MSWKKKEKCFLLTEHQISKIIVDKEILSTFFDMRVTISKNFQTLKTKKKELVWYYNNYLLGVAISSAHVSTTDEPCCPLVHQVPLLSQGEVLLYQIDKALGMMSWEL